MARTRKNLSENIRTLIDDLTFVLGRAKSGFVGDNEINDLNLCIWRIRQESPPQGTEEQLIETYKTAAAAYKQAGEAIAAFYGPLAEACKTEEEARALLERMPSSVEKAWVSTYFVVEAKLIPRSDRA